jgi:GH25 family lysozyme M1 (1,4-beta-N-acetylmuramidase)
MAPSNPPLPSGYHLMKQSAVTAAMTAWAVDILHNAAQFPMFATAKRDFNGHAILARVEWHPPDFQNHVEHRGVTLYEATNTPIQPPLPVPPVPPVPPAPPSSSLAFGIDVSHYQTSIDWARAARAGVSFAFIKATEGNTFVDPTFTAHWADAGNASVLRAPYHFFRPRISVAAQGDLFMARTNAEGELPPILDAEESDGVPPAQLVLGVQSWLQLVLDRVDRAIVYTSPQFWNALPAGTTLDPRVDLWIAAWGVAKPPTVNGFKRWSFWQYTNRASVLGASGPLDGNHFNGAVSDLQAYSQSFIQGRQAVLAQRTQQSA